MRSIDWCIYMCYVVSVCKQIGMIMSPRAYSNARAYLYLNQNRAWHSHQMNHKANQSSLYVNLITLIDSLRLVFFPPL